MLGVTGAVGASDLPHRLVERMLMREVTQIFGLFHESHYPSENRVIRFGLAGLGVQEVDVTRDRIRSPVSFTHLLPSKKGAPRSAPFHI